jgi:hypothetical protein
MQEIVTEHTLEHITLVLAMSTSFTESCFMSRCAQQQRVKCEQGLVFACKKFENT